MKRNLPGRLLLLLLPPRFLTPTSRPFVRPFPADRARRVKFVLLSVSRPLAAVCRLQTVIHSSIQTSRRDCMKKRLPRTYDFMLQMRSEVRPPPYSYTWPHYSGVKEMKKEASSSSSFLNRRIYIWGSEPAEQSRPFDGASIPAATVALRSS